MSVHIKQQVLRAADRCKRHRKGNAEQTLTTSLECEAAIKCATAGKCVNSMQRCYFGTNRTWFYFVWMLL